MLTIRDAQSFYFGLQTGAGVGATALASSFVTCTILKNSGSIVSGLGEAIICNLVSQSCDGIIGPLSLLDATKFLAVFSVIGGIVNMIDKHDELGEAQRAVVQYRNNIAASTNTMKED